MHEPSTTSPKLGHPCCALFTNKTFAASEQFVNPSTQLWQALARAATDNIQTAKGTRRFVGEGVALQTGRQQNWEAKKHFSGQGRSSATVGSEAMQSFHFRIYFRV